MGCMLIWPLKVVIISAINQNGQCHLLGTGENGAIQTFHRSQLPKLRFTTSKHLLKKVLEKALEKVLEKRTQENKKMLKENWIAKIKRRSTDRCRNSDLRPQNIFFHPDIQLWPLLTFHQLGGQSISTL